MTNLITNNPAMIKTLGKEWIILNESVLRKNVSNRMREYWLSSGHVQEDCYTLKKKK